MMIIPDVANTSVYPSGTAFTARSVAMLPPAPEAFSITIGCPKAFDSSSPITRAAKSAGPPAANPTIIRIGLSG
jgi:hypothetical protein